MFNSSKKLKALEKLLDGDEDKEVLLELKKLKYKDEDFESLRSWIALGISFIALIISIFAIYYK